MGMMKVGESTEVKEHPSENPGQMPILLENHTPEIRYIVGSQLKAGDLVLPSKEPEQDETGDMSLPATTETDEKEEDKEVPSIPSPTMEENFENAEPLSTSSPRKDIDVESPPKEILDTENAISEELENEDSEKSLNDSKLPSKLANIEKIIPESDDSEPDKSDSDSSSSSDQPSSDSEWESFPDKKKESGIKPQPEEITIDDDDNVNDKSDSNKYHDAFQSFLSKSKEEETESEIEEDPMERKRRTRQTSKLKQKQKEKEKANKPIVVTSDPADDEVIIYDPLEEEMKEKENKQKQIENLDLKDVKLSDEDTSNDEMEGNKGKSDWDTNQQKSQFEKNLRNKKSRKRSPSISKSREEDIPCADIPSKPKEDSKTSKSQTNKVSMVAAIFRAKKKKQEEEKVIDEKHEDIDQKLKSIATRVLLPKGSKKVEISESEMEREKEKVNIDIDDSNENKQKVDGTSEEKEVVPVDKLTIPEELCKMKTTGRGRGTKKFFVCQICEEQFDKADKMKLHLYNDHYDDFIRCSVSVPDILEKSNPIAENKQPLPLEDKIPDEKDENTVISKPSALARVFKRKGSKKVIKPKE